MQNIIVTATATLLELLSDIADKHKIEISFNRAKEQNKQYDEMCDQELHIQVLAWLDEQNFWYKLPQCVPMPDGSGYKHKDALMKLTNQVREMIMIEIAATL